ncbi:MULTISPECIES: ABC transporter permease [unclassified Janthinobacterium]|uniref:ABC transporter permease n=1 Tax=unclassified Janthinobacterium TaxID=2610881 RepID=UPI001612AF92|nr:MULTISPECIES: ABC transporter permease [unclassified Janthinobacterium]MBB5605821.1 putative ABC transport system permease protein [Janthinobacterium sp. S3T4]MBB5611260.1 putative ABC transport system permease protein [Janthinobacterium sp. S3M3]
MLRYYFMLGLRSLRRNPALTALMVLTLAIGVAASVSTLTILHVMSGNPLPDKNGRMFVPLVDNGSLSGYTPGDKTRDNQLSYRDAVNFQNSKMGERRSAMYGMGGTIEPQNKDLSPFSSQGLAAYRDFFPMFETPFLYGQPWSEADDTAGADVIVLSRKLAQKLYGDSNPVGQRMSLMGSQFQITGVLDTWEPVPRIHRIVGSSAFGSEDSYFIPFTSAIRHQVGVDGNMSCDGNREAGYQGTLDSECTWLQFWFEMASDGQRGDLQNYLDSYAQEQRKLGRLKRNAPNQLFSISEWLEHLHVVGNDNKLSAWLAFGFLALCLVNTIGLLLAKFSVRASEVGIRRALGASRAEIFRQFLIETTVIGLVGGVLGLLLAFGALALIGMQSKQLTVAAHMDWVMLAMTFVISVAAAILAGLLPTWRACQVTPAIQLKSQ